MKTVLHTAVFFAALVALPATSFAATYDLSGDWSYVYSDKTVVGACPLGPLNEGTLRIVQSGDTATLEVLTGGECSPASMCFFDCSIVDDEYTCTNSDVVDDEGGVAENTSVFTAFSANAADGPAVSIYTLGSFVCQWDYTVTMTRTGDGPGPDPSDDDEGGCNLSATAPGSGALMLVGCMLLLAWLRRRSR
jgi:hypothetical protein